MILNFLVSCKKSDVTETKQQNQETQRERVTLTENIKKSNKAGCDHKLMKVTILPHPPDYDVATSIEFCFYEKINGIFRFYSGNKPLNAILEIDDENSIKW